MIARRLELRANIRWQNSAKSINIWPANEHLQASGQSPSRALGCLKLPQIASVFPSELGASRSQIESDGSSRPWSFWRPKTVLLARARWAPAEVKTVISFGILATSSAAQSRRASRQKPARFQSQRQANSGPGARPRAASSRAAR